MSQSEELRCPMCGTPHGAFARYCLNCGDPLLSPSIKFDSTNGMWRDGILLVVKKGAEFPPICVKTNLPTDRQMTQLLYWHPLWYYLVLLFFTPFIYVLLHNLASHTVDLTFGISPERQQRRWLIIVAAWISSLIGIGCIVVGLRASSNKTTAALAPLFGVLWLMTSVTVGYVFSRVVTAAKINGQFAWIRGVHPDFLAALPDFPSED